MHSNRCLWSSTYVGTWRNGTADANRTMPWPIQHLGPFFFPQLQKSSSMHYLKSVFSEISQDMSPNSFPPKTIELWLADLSGLSIRGLFFGRETSTWTHHVLTLISEKTDFSRSFPTASAHAFDSNCAGRLPIGRPSACRQQNWYDQLQFSWYVDEKS